MRHAMKAVQYKASMESTINTIRNITANMQADLDCLAQKNAQSDSFIRQLADGDYDDINKVIAAAQVLIGDA
jgi:hypothetical protein